MQLFLTTYGTYLHVKDELFEIRVPSQEEKGRYEKTHMAAKKVTSIVMATAAALSTDAVALALRHNIDIIFTERDGEPLGRIWHSKLGSTTRIRKRQLEASLGPEALWYTQQWLGRKLANQYEFLIDLKKHRPRLAGWLMEKGNGILELKTRIESLEGPGIQAHNETLRGLEGTAGRIYFATLGQLPPKAFQFQGRSFRPAEDPFNALLNYGYGVLYSQVEKALILAGLDPYVGFLHRDDYNQKSMVFDFIEPFRIWVERPVLRLFTGKQVNQSHYHQLSNGIGLTKEGKQLTVGRFNEFFRDERIRYRGRNQTRANALQQEAHQFANELIKKAKEGDT